MDFDTISFFYGLGYLYPNIEWYVEHGFINSDQYKQITGKAYVAPTTQSTTTSTTN
ncbi:XkdX family protein [Levilactobacillus wangkuiensis]|uniref:XkdX family protein n=1 Tax=Levilactobacillus wangkuiensis TaxID=2799566 RepID=UPI001940E64D|nr:XkdX family protein [Levilactobacillus wangkuiensis]